MKVLVVPCYRKFTLLMFSADNVSLAKHFQRMCGFSCTIKVLQFQWNTFLPSVFPSFLPLQYLFLLVSKLLGPAAVTQRQNKMKIHETKIKKGQCYMTDLNQNTNPQILLQEMQFSLHLTIPTIYRRPASLLLVLFFVCAFLFFWCWRVIKSLPVAGHLHPYQELISALVLAAALIHPQCPLLHELRINVGSFLFFSDMAKLSRNWDVFSIYLDTFILGQP